MVLHYAPKYASVSNPVLTLAPIVSPLRIVCLVPSITELIVDMGFGDYLIGRTGFCIHPATVVQHIPKVGGTKAVNLDKIRALAPTHVVVNVDENEKPTVDALRQSGVQVVVTHPQGPGDNIALIDQLLAVFLTQVTINSVAAPAIIQRAKGLKDQISARLLALQAHQTHQTHQGHNPASLPAQRVLYLIWQDPWMTVARDTYISRMLDLIGWQTWPALDGGDGIATPGAGRYPVVHGSEPWLEGIDRVLLSSEPYSFGPDHIAQVQNWLPHTKVQLVDGEMLSWYGSRAIQGLDYLLTLSANGLACVDGTATTSISPV
jgi:ABC-type hemin transport system substrate-binding protein